MDKASLINQPVVIKCLAHDGYRRAGLAFKTGINTLQAGTVTRSQLAMLEADPCLALCQQENQAAETDTPDNPSGPVVQGCVSDGVSQKACEK